MSNSPLVISNIPVRQDAEGRYCLNDLHKASGNNKNHRPSNFIRTSQTKALIAEISRSSNMSFGAVNTARGGNNGNSTYACKELVYAYAMWISASFSLKVIRAYDGIVTTQPALPSPDIEQSTPYQKQPLQLSSNFEAAKDRITYILKWTSENRNEALHDDLMSIYWCIDFAKKKMDESVILQQRAIDELNIWK